MSAELHDERIADLFARAKDLSAEDQARFLDEECRNDPAEVRQRVEKLLAADRQLHATADLERPEKEAADIQPSRTIGAFKLLQPIGEGGMGEVWMAEQQHPVRRRVALKLIKSDSPTKEIIARFEAERQALAMMDHPNIAKVLDVGQTETGQPYFVMDLVQGVPITDYCDRNKLTPRERLALFVPVCQAIQHAHQKGIIHRDIKPSNVLVTLYDGKPVAKVIDFGLAKALQTQTRLTDKTLFTEFGRVVGTLRYMSPEQAEMNALDVDTRTDVYSLGVMLYELLTGSTPLDQETIKEKALFTVLQLIREQEPPPPSKRLSDSGEAVSGISAQRRIEPAQLSRILKGDLDWVVMKALEKDRTRRYETAASLAEDVQRYLDNEPVQARPPSFRYRFGKFARKHRAAVLAGSVVLATLIIGILATGTSATFARREQLRADKEADQARLEKARADDRTKEALEQKARAESEKARADTTTTEALAAKEQAEREKARAQIALTEKEEALKAAESSRIEAEAERKSAEAARKEAEVAQMKTIDTLRWTTGEVVEKLIASKEILGSNERAYLQSALTRWQALADEHGDSVMAQHMRSEGAFNVARLQARLGERQAALTNYHQAIRIMSRLGEQFPAVPEYQKSLAESYNNLGLLLSDLGDQTAARDAHEAGLAIRKKLVEQFAVVPQYQQDLATSYNNLGNLLGLLGELEAARAAYEAGLAIREKLVEQSPAVPEYQSGLASVHNNLGNLLSDLGDTEQARAAYEEALAIRQKLAERFPAVPLFLHELAMSHNNLGILLRSIGDQEKARAACEAGLAIREQLVEQFPAVPEYQEALAATHNNIGLLLKDIGDPEAARAEFEAGLSIRRNLVEGSPAVPLFQQRLAKSYYNLASLLVDLGDRKAARAAYERGLAIQRKLVEHFSAVPQYQHDFAMSHCALGLLLSGLGEHKAARTMYERGLAIQRELVELFPAVPEYKQGLAGSQINLGNLLSDDVGDRDAARAAYESGLAIQKELVEQFPAVPEYKQWLAASHINFASFLSGAGDRDAARIAFESALTIQKELVEQFPAVPEYRHSLAALHNNLGALLASQEKHDAARGAFEATLTISEKLVDQFPAVWAYKFELGLGYYNLGELSRHTGKLGETLDMFDKAVQFLKIVHDREPRDVKAKTFLRNSYNGRAQAYDRLHRYAEAVKDWDSVIELSTPTEQPVFRLARALSQVRAGMVGEAVAEVAELSQQSNLTAIHWYAFACIHATASTKVPDKHQEYSNRAMELLHKAVDAGFQDIKLLKTNKDIAPLRDRDDFKKLIAELEAQMKSAVQEQP
jgi:serine/threonine protein kinase